MGYRAKGPREYEKSTEIRGERKGEAGSPLSANQGWRQTAGLGPPRAKRSKGDGETLVGNRKTQKRNHSGEREQAENKVIHMPEVDLRPLTTTDLQDLKG